MTGERTKKAIFEDVVLFFYLVIGAVGTATLVAIVTDLRIVDFLRDNFILLIVAVHVFANFAWIPAIALIIVYRRSWLIILPAATAIASSLGMFFAIFSRSNLDPTGPAPIAIAPIVWVAAIFPVFFICGFFGVIKRVLNSDT